MAANYISTAPIANSTPGFSFGRSGICNSGTFLQIDGVPSNKAGRFVPFDIATLDKVFIVCDSDSTFSVDIQIRSGSSYNTVYTANVTAARTATFSPDDVPLVLGDEICVKLSSGSCSNIIVGMIVKGIGV